MAKLRRACAYRQLERPYTRRSKFRSKSFIRTTPQSKVVRYDMGNPAKSLDFPIQIFLRSKENLQIRHNAIESARLVCNRVLEGKVGKPNYHLKIRIFPHHILRENPLASGAGADRMSTGMKMSFGKAIGSAAQVRKDQILFQVNTLKDHIQIVKIALKKAQQKFPCTCKIEVVELKGKQALSAEELASGIKKRGPAHGHGVTVPEPAEEASVEDTAAKSAEEDKAEEPQEEPAPAAEAPETAEASAEQTA